MSEPTKAISLVRDRGQEAARITQQEWDELRKMVTEIHVAMTGVAGAVPQVLADIKSKGIMGLIMGAKH